MRLLPGSNKSLERRFPWPTVSRMAEEILPRKSQGNPVMKRLAMVASQETPTRSRAEAQAMAQGSRR